MVGREDLSLGFKGPTGGDVDGDLITPPTAPARSQLVIKTGLVALRLCHGTALRTLKETVAMFPRKS